MGSVVADRERGIHRIGAKLSEIILGGQDGLVNVAGVILGLAAATPDTKIIIAGGLAATFAESISMAAVAYTSALAERDYYHAQRARELSEIKLTPHLERAEVEEIFTGWGFQGHLLEEAVHHVTMHEECWLDIMMAHELRLPPKDENGLLFDSLLVGVSAVGGSLIPLLPFFFLPRIPAMWVGLILSALTLFAVGVFKAHITVGKRARSGIQMMVIGVLSALAGFAVGAIFSG